MNRFSMKNFVVTAAVILVALSLASCGGSSKTWPTSNLTKFVYLADTSSEATSVRGTHSSARARQMRARGVAAHHAAKPRAVQGYDIATGTEDVYLYDLVSNTTTKLNTTSADYDSVALSADYKTVYFTAYDSNEYAQLFSASVANFNSPTQLTTGTAGDYHDASISHDGKTISAIYFNESAAAVTSLESIASLPSSGGTPTLMAISGLDELWTPRLTPDNSTYILEGEASDNGAAIFSVKVDGTGLTQLTNANGDWWDWFPTVSPDGKTISFIREGDGEDVYVVPITGETTAAPATAITTDHDADEAVILGGYIAYVDYVKTADGSGNGQLFLVLATGGNAVQLTTADEQVYFDWWDD
jgi:Tol biopolymer transport system component